MRKFEGFQRGVNLGGWISQCVSYDKEHFDNFIVKKDIEQIAGWGLDHVRLPIDYDVIQEEDETMKEEGLKHIDDCIAWAKDCGLKVILDVHKAKGYMFDMQEVANPDAFFEDEELQAAFIRLWETLAKRYAKYSDMVAFELLNEIINPKMDKIWNGIAKRAMTAIRAIAPDTYILVGGVCYNSVACVPLLDAPMDDKIVYNFHCYEPLIFTHQAAYWVEGMPSDFRISYPKKVEEYREVSKTIGQAAMGAIFDESMVGEDIGVQVFEKLFANALAYAEKMNVPLYCGEYGVIDQAPLPETVKWFEDIHSIFEKYNIGRAVWNYKQKDFGLVDPHYADVQADIIKNL